MSPKACAFRCGTTRLVMSTSPKTFVSNMVRMAATSSTPISRAIGVAGVVDERIDAAHARERLIDGALVVVAARHIRHEAVRAGLRRERIDAVLVAARERHLMSGRARLFHQRRANALARAGDEQFPLRHRRIIDPGARPTRPWPGLSPLPRARRSGRRRSTPGHPAPFRPIRSGSARASSRTARPARYERRRRVRNTRDSDRFEHPAATKRRTGSEGLTMTSVA